MFNRCLVEAEKMAPGSNRMTLNIDDRIGDSATRSTSMNLPIAVQRRLDEMAELADAVRPTRNELLAALVATAELDEAALEDMVVRYRRMRVRDVLPARDHAGGDSDVVVPLRRPGRPSTKGGAG
jgi:hypothetical protein